MYSPNITLYDYFFEGNVSDRPENRGKINNPTSIFIYEKYFPENSTDKRGQRVLFKQNLNYSLR